nr:hypothetical protein [Paraflavitalea speifideiaquila]
MILNNYERIINYIRTQSPKTALYVQSVLPLYEPLTTAAYLKNKKTAFYS